MKRRDSDLCKCFSFSFLNNQPAYEEGVVAYQLNLILFQSIQVCFIFKSKSTFFWYIRHFLIPYPIWAAVSETATSNKLCTLMLNNLKMKMKPTTGIHQRYCPLKHDASLQPIFGKALSLWPICNLIFFDKVKLQTFDTQSTFQVLVKAKISLYSALGSNNLNRQSHRIKLTAFSYLERKP